MIYANTLSENIVVKKLQDTNFRVSRLDFHNGIIDSIILQVDDFLALRNILNHIFEESPYTTITKKEKSKICQKRIKSKKK